MLRSREGLPMVGSLTSLIWLSLGAFAIGTEGFMIAGLLPALAHDLDVDLPAAGHLVTAFSVAYAIGAPVLTVLTAGLERKRLLAVAMGGSLANLLAALAPGYAWLIGARLLLALSAASFMPAAGGYAAGLAGPERQGRALSMVIGGLTVAIIAGVPLGVLLGDALGWRATFLGVAGIAAFSLLGILAWLPRQAPGVVVSLGDRMALARSADVLSILATTVLTVAGTFTVYTYLGVFVHVVTGLGPRGLAVVLLVFGVASAAGTRIAGSAADHWGARRMVIGLLCSLSRPSASRHASPKADIPTCTHSSEASSEKIAVVASEFGSAEIRPRETIRSLPMNGCQWGTNQT
jgi:predicted MFS family arabinose efflux permease